MQLMKHLYMLEGVVACGYLAEVLRDAVPAMQGHVLDAFGDVNDSTFVDVASDLARHSLDASVKTKAQAFVQKRGVRS